MQSRLLGTDQGRRGTRASREKVNGCKQQRREDTTTHSEHTRCRVGRVSKESAYDYTGHPSAPSQDVVLAQSLKSRESGEGMSNALLGLPITSLRIFN